MKTFAFLFSLFFVSFNAFSQGSYIQDKKGNKIEFLKNSVQVVVLDKVVSYKTPSGSSKDIAFKDINEAVFGLYKFKNFAFAENKNNYCYFVLAESPKLTLICLGIPNSDSEEDGSFVKTQFELYVLDNSQYKVVDSMVCNNVKNEKGAAGRSQTYDFIFRNFGKCTDLMDRFSDYEKSNLPQFMGVLGFFNQPNFVICP